MFVLLLVRCEIRPSRPAPAPPALRPAPTPVTPKTREGAVGASRGLARPLPAGTRPLKLEVLALEVMEVEVLV
jgi:hypothetical protein